MNRDTEALLQRALRAQLEDLKARRRDRKRREWEERLDDSLVRRGYPVGVARGRRR